MEETATKVEEPPTPVQNEARRPPASAFILEALGKEAGRGIAGPQLQAMAQQAGYTKDAFEKARTRCGTRAASRWSMDCGRFRSRRACRVPPRSLSS